MRNYLTCSLMLQPHLVRRNYSFTRACLLSLWNISGGEQTPLWTYFDQNVFLPWSQELGLAHFTKYCLNFYFIRSNSASICRLVQLLGVWNWKKWKNIFVICYNSSCSGGETEMRGCTEQLRILVCSFWCIWCWLLLQPGARLGGSLVWSGVVVLGM